MQEILTTQISSKYSPDNMGVFDFRQKLMRAGFNVVFPAGNSIIEYEQEFAITIPEEAIVPFHVTEGQFLSEIQKNPFHITYNIFGPSEGYIGESTSIETAYALACDKPIFIMREMHYGPRVPRSVQEILEKYENSLHLHRLDLLNPRTIRRYILNHTQDPIAYNLSRQDRRTVNREIRTLTREYQEAWSRYLANKQSPPR